MLLSPDDERDYDVSMSSTYGGKIYHFRKTATANKSDQTFYIKTI